MVIWVLTLGWGVANKRHPDVFLLASFVPPCNQDTNGHANVCTQASITTSDPKSTYSRDEHEEKNLQ